MGGPRSPCGDPRVHWILPVLAQGAPSVVLDPFMVALGASGAPMVALGLSGFPHGGPGFSYGLQVSPCWPWSSLGSVLVALEPFEVILCLLMVAPEPCIVTWRGVRGCGRDCGLDSWSAATILCPASFQAGLPNQRVLTHLLIFLVVICGFCGSRHLSCPGAKLWEPCWGVGAALSVQWRVFDACSGLPWHWLRAGLCRGVSLGLGWL